MTFSRLALRPFLSSESVNRSLLGVFVLVNGIVLINACLHDPTIAYDGPLALALCQNPVHRTPPNA